MQDLNKKRLFIVLGMHRSGTSAITRGLSVLGVELGDRLMAAVEGNNAKGFWEDIDLNALNIDILKFLASDWSYLSMVTPDHVNKLRQGGFFLRAVELMRKKTSNARYFGFKDPRVAKLMPFWSEVFAYCGFDVSYIFAIRHPLSVARSLAKRDGMEREQAYLLWLGHVITGLIHSAGSPCVMVDYDRLMQDPDSELARLAKGLGLELNASALQNYKDDFLEEGLRHTVYQADDLLIDYSCPRLVHDVYATLLAMASDQIGLLDAAAQEKISDWLKQYDQLQSSLQLADKLLEQKTAVLARSWEQEERLRTQQQACNDSLAAQKQAIDERDLRIAGMEELIRLREKQVSDLEHTVAVREAQNVDAAERSAQQEEQMMALRAELDACNSCAVEKAAQQEESMMALRAEFEACNADASAHAAQQAEQIKTLRAELDERNAELGEMKVAQGERMDALELELKAVQQGQLAALSSELLALKTEQAALVAVLQGSQDTEVASLRRAVAELQQREHLQNNEFALQYARDLADSARKLALAENVLAEREAMIAQMQQQIDDRSAQIALLGQRQIVLEQRVRASEASHQAVLNEIWNSTSWRLTKVVRAAGRLLKGNGAPAVQMRPAAAAAVTAELVQAQEMAAVVNAATVAHQEVENEIKALIPQIDFDTTRNQFVPLQDNPPISPLVKAIAFYLPQFHPFAENDAWWGKGFTEWTNVGKALPNYKGHYQPHCPIHNGYYDLRIPEVMEEQARLAKLYGVYGFSYYFYWFGGKILMDTPLELMLANKKVDMPFCFTWANENWTRRWDGAEHDVLIGQNHGDEDSLAFIRHLVKYFKDERYIRVDGKPVLIIYRANIIPNMAGTAKIWREELKKHGIPGLYLVSAQSFGIRSPDEFDFDASVEFPPHTSVSAEISSSLEMTNPDFKGNIYNYEQVVENAISSPEPDYKLFRTVMLSWDNTARKQNNSHTFHNFTLLRYKQWLSSVTNKVFSNKKYSQEEKFVFINAWNEWAEGTHLEPDQKFGFGYLQTTYDVLRDYDSKVALPQLKYSAPVRRYEQAVILHLHYSELWNGIRGKLQEAIGPHGFDLYVTVTSGEAMAMVLRDFPAAHVELVENRGRDVLPFIRMLKLIASMGYSAVCKIHSKRSVYRGDGDAIRDEIFEALMGSKEHVGSTLSRFKGNEQLGMLVPQKYLIPHTDHNMTFDHEVVARVSRHMGMNFEYGQFPAGSMFWFSPHSLTPLLDVDDSFFEIESGLADGTIAHAIERLFCHIVRYSDYLVESC